MNKTLYLPENGPVVFATTGSFRNRDMLEPVVLALDQLKEEIDFTLKVIGPVSNNENKKLLSRNYVEYIGGIDLQEVANIVQKSHIFLFSHLNPPCPNSVLEAIACGIPVVGFDSGSMSELCWFSKDLLAPVSDDVFQLYEDFDYIKLAEKIKLCVDNYENFKRRALEHSGLYSFEECGSGYVEVFEKVLNQEKSSNNRVVTKMSRLKQFIKSMKPFELINRMKHPGSYADYITEQIRKKLNGMSPFEALKLLFTLDNNLYEMEGEQAIRFDDGIHTKHRHIRYHDFFINIIDENMVVLDAGCGNGELAGDIAQSVTGVYLFAVDISESKITMAKRNYPYENVEFFCEDIRTFKTEREIDIIILSNVLEHFDDRIGLLKYLNDTFKPEKVLIRVPLFERDWRVPLKREIGVEYRLDKTHYTEYRLDDFIEEMNNAGLKIISQQVNWGEIWAVVKKQ